MFCRTLFVGISACAVLASGSHAKSTGSLRDGNWSDPSTLSPVWNNGIPATSDTVDVAHQITFDAQFAAPPLVGLDALNILASGSLNMLAARSLTTTTFLNDGMLSHGGLIFRADNIDGVGTIAMSASTILSAAHVRQRFMSIGAGASAAVRPNGTDAATSKLETLSIAGATNAWTGNLDLSDNALVVDYTSGSPLAAIANQIKIAWNGSDWTGKGIGSTNAANTFVDGTKPHKTAIGFGEASDVIPTFPNTFVGQSVDASSVVIRYTLYGDASLDKLVDTVDFNLLAANFGASGSRWTKGDFNYDGVIDTTDFNLLASNFGQIASGDAMIGVSVPEPAVASISLIALTTALRFRRVRARLGR
jgi:hypothetical protein